MFLNNGWKGTFSPQKWLGYCINYCQTSSNISALMRFAESMSHKVSKVWAISYFFQDIYFVHMAVVKSCTISSYFPYSFYVVHCELSKLLSLWPDCLSSLIKRTIRPNSWTKSLQKSSEFSSLLFTVSSTALLEISISSNSHNLLQFL